jgi:6-phosphogluconolactonase
VIGAPELELVVEPDAEAAARRAAGILAAATREAVAARGRSSVALSGGTAPLRMFERLADEPVPWERVEILQVDERIAPDGDPDRNLTAMLAHLPPEAAGSIRPMPVTEDDLAGAARRYAAELPASFDLVHLGVGGDGHTASLVLGDPVLEVRDGDVALTGEYGGRRRMTLTYPALERAALVLWLVLGADKGPVVRALVAHDPSIPAGRVRAARQLLVADTPAVALLGR